jgi:hypothetical protein
MTIIDRYDQITDLLYEALQGQEVEHFQPVYQYVKLLAQFFIVDAKLQTSVENLILDKAIRIYGYDYGYGFSYDFHHHYCCCYGFDDADAAEDEDLLPICKTFEFAKFIYCDQDLKNRVEEVLFTQVSDCGCLVTPAKLKFLKDALHYAY